MYNLYICLYSLFLSLRKKFTSQRKRSSILTGFQAPGGFISTNSPLSNPSAFIFLAFFSLKRVYVSISLFFLEMVPI